MPIFGQRLNKNYYVLMASYVMSIRDIIVKMCLLGVW